MDGKQMKPSDVPDVIDVKIGSKLEAKWQETLDKIEEAIMVDKINVKLAEGSRKIALEEIKKEKENFK